MKNNTENTAGSDCQERLVRLSDAMVAWNPAWSICPRGGEPGQVGVCNHPDNGQLRHLSMWVKPSSHAETCPYDKKEMATMLKLMIEAWHIACRDGVPLANIHAALSAIPEYNEMLAEDFKIFLPNVKEHAPLSAGASVERGVEVETTEDHENKAADRGCCVSACSDSSFAVDGVADGGKIPRKNLPVIVAALANLGLHLLLLQGDSRAQGLSDVGRVSEIPVTHSELRTDLGNRDIIGDPGVFGGMVGSSGTLDAATTPDDETHELAAADLSLAVENRLAHPNVPILGQIVPKENADQPRGNGDEQLDKVGFHDDDGIWIQIVGGLIGIALGCLLISLPNAESIRHHPNHGKQ